MSQKIRSYWPNTNPLRHHTFVVVLEKTTARGVNNGRKLRAGFHEASGSTLPDFSDPEANRLKR